MTERRLVRRRRARWAGSVLMAAVCACLWLMPAPIVNAQQAAPGRKPNIVVIFGDDIGTWNISAYHRGMMGGRTPNIDKLAQQGAMFTDYYSQNSCTAGRAAFITGQSPLRTGMLKVGLPGAKQGIQDKDPTIAEMLKVQGYATAQIGKNHLGDRNEYLPTRHGFDQFYGNLYHLNSEEEPEDPDYPKDPAFHAQFGPRGVLDCRAADRDDPTELPRFGSWGKQTCKDTGPLNSKRMETLEDDLLAHSVAFMKESVKANRPFFLWHASSRMHVWTHLQDKWKNKTGFGLYADGMMELDNVVGEIMKTLDELGIADNTIIMFSSDNGAEMFTWPDGGMNPFKGEKGTTWEGGFRVPTVVRWPGVIKPGTIYNEIMSHEDWMPTLLAAAGDTGLKDRLLKGITAGGKTFKTHLDGYNFMPFFKGETDKGPRREFFYFDDNSNLNALRYDQWKITFAWIEGHLFSGKRTSANVPLVVNLRQDPFERTPFESDAYRRFQADKLWTLVPAQTIAAQFIQSFKDYPPSQRSGSMNLDQVMEMLASGAGK